MPWWTSLLGERMLSSGVTHSIGPHLHILPYIQNFTDNGGFRLGNGAELLS